MGNGGLGGAVFGGGQKRLDCFEVFCACGLEGWNGEGGQGRLISEYRRGIGVDGVAWWRVLRCGGEGMAGFGHDGCGSRRGTLVSCQLIYGRNFEILSRRTIMRLAVSLSIGQGKLLDKSVSCIK